jgi:hypothetical protein
VREECGVDRAYFFSNSRRAGAPRDEEVVGNAGAAGV